jgi:phage repressor protein C with HTH and peptisase S24 domain
MSMAAISDEINLNRQAGLLEISQHDATSWKCDISHAMSEQQQTDEPRYYRLINSLRPEGLNDNAWTRKAGVSSSFFRDLKKKGTRPRHDTLEKILDAVGVSMARFEALEAPVLTEVASGGTRDPHREFYGERPLPMIPLLGTAMGGEYGNLDQHIEMTELHLHEVMDHLARPVSLTGDPHAYALTIVGDSMWPRFRPGRRVIVTPRGTPSIGDDVIVQLLGAADDEGDRRVAMVLIKELVRRTPGYIELRQFNPDITFRIEASRVAAVHKVMGEIF